MATARWLGSWQRIGRCHGNASRRELARLSLRTPVRRDRTYPGRLRERSRLHIIRLVPTHLPPKSSPTALYTPAGGEFRATRQKNSRRRKSRIERSPLQLQLLGIYKSLFPSTLHR